MTALNYWLTEKAVYVSADSLCRLQHPDGTSHEQGQMEKVRIVPGTNVIVWSSGGLDLFGDYYDEVAALDDLSDIHTLDEYAGSSLHRLRVPSSPPFDLGLFAYSEEEERPVGYRYRSTTVDGEIFRYEVKPTGDTRVRFLPTYTEEQYFKWIGRVESDGWFPSVFDIMQEQQKSDTAAKGYRAIGGDVVSAVITASNPSPHVTRETGVFDE